MTNTKVTTFTKFTDTNPVVPTGKAHPSGASVKF